jgi:hypothetical protein
MTLLGNPAIAGMIDTAAGQIAPQQQQTAGQAATNTQGSAANTAAQQAGKALGNLVGETVGAQGKSAVSQFVGGFVNGLAQGLENSLGNFTPAGPSKSDNCSPGKPTQLTKDSDGKVHTPGGYTIEATGKYDWKITGPDGQCTEVWGDPHVRLKDKDGKVIGNWDFKKDSTFFLPDGTHINVQCVPYGDMTVTSALEIWRDGENVDITGIDKGKGKVSDVTFDDEDIKTQQTFMSGMSTTQWLWEGQEILGNIDGKADTFKKGRMVLEAYDHNRTGGWGGNYGNGWYGLNNTERYQPQQPTQPTTQQPNPAASDKLAQVMKILEAVTGLLKSITGLINIRPQTNPYITPDPAPPSTNTQPKYDPRQHEAGLRSAFTAFGQMLQTLGQIMQMAASVKGLRPQGA